MIAPGLSIGQVAERTGLSVHALRLLRARGHARRTGLRGPGRRRVYSEDDVEWLGICTRFRASGMPLTGRFASTPSSSGRGRATSRSGSDLLQAHRDQVIARIAELTESLDMITTRSGSTATTWPRAPPPRCGARRWLPVSPCHVCRCRWLLCGDRTASRARSIRWPLVSTPTSASTATRGRRWSSTSDVFGGTLDAEHLRRVRRARTRPEADKIMHGQLETDSGFTLMGADTPPGHGAQPRRQHRGEPER